MGIRTYYQYTGGDVDFCPNLWGVSTTDNLAAVTADGYFDEVSDAGLKDGDFVLIMTSLNVSSGLGTPYLGQLLQKIGGLTLVIFDLNNLPLNNGQIYVGNASNVATGVTMSGDVAIDNTGATTIQDAAVTLAKLAAIAQGHIIRGNASGVGELLDATTADRVLAGNGTTCAMSQVNKNMLADAVSPSHVTKFAGTVTWSGAGATLAHTVTGVQAGDIVVATIHTMPNEGTTHITAVPSTDTITFGLSTANTSNDAVISYAVQRATA